MHFDYVQCAECFRRDHPFPIPERTIMKSPLRPKRDMLGVRTMALDVYTLWASSHNGQGRSSETRALYPALQGAEDAVLAN